MYSRRQCRLCHDHENKTNSVQETCEHHGCHRPISLVVVYKDVIIVLKSTVLITVKHDHRTADVGIFSAIAAVCPRSVAESILQAVHFDVRPASFRGWRGGGGGVRGFWWWKRGDFLSADVRTAVCRGHWLSYGWALVRQVGEGRINNALPKQLLRLWP